MKTFCAMLAAFLAVAAGAAAHDAPATPKPVDLDTVAKTFGWDFEADVKVEKISDRLHVIFGVGGNVAASVGDTGVLVVDDQFPQMIGRIDKAIGKLGGKGVQFAVNTHWHFDHADGNKALGPKGTWIVSHSNSREMMLDDHVIDLVILAYDQNAYPPKALPVLTYDDAMQFHWNGERIDLRHYGAAHTTGDTAVFFRGSNAVHMGDVYVSNGFPFIDHGNGGSLDGVIAFCRAALAEIDDDTVVIPGHGELAKKGDLAGYVKMLETVRERMVKEIRKGATLDDVLKSGIADEWAEGSLTPKELFLNRAYMSLTHRPPL